MVFLKKLFKTKHGFSLVEILIAMAVLGAGAVGVMKTMDTVSKSSEKAAVQVDFEQFLFGLDNYLGRFDVCEAQFKNVDMGTTVTSLLDPTVVPAPGISNVIFTTGGSYLDDKIIIEEMKLIKTEEAVPALRVTFKRRDSKRSSFYQYIRDIYMVHELDATKSKIDRCYETESATFNLAEKLCEDNSGEYNDVTKTCHFRGFGADKSCPTGQVFTRINYDPITLTYTPVCGAILDGTQCADGWIKSVQEDGVITCLNLNDIISTETATFTSAGTRTCGLQIVSNKIKLVCGAPAPAGCTPVNGGWTPWVVEGCLATGFQDEYRTCTSPAPSCGGTSCAGAAYQNNVTPCSSECADGQTAPGDVISNTPNTTFCGSVFTGNRIVYKRKVCVGGSWTVGAGKCFQRTQNVCSSGCVPPTMTGINCSSSGVENTSTYIKPMGSGTFNFNTFTGSCSSGGGGGGCFLKNSLISMGNGTLKNIQDIVVGDELMDGSGQIVTVQKLLRRNYQGIVFGINGGVKFATTNHPFQTTDGWKSLDPNETNKESPELAVTGLKLGDVLITESGMEVVWMLDFEERNEMVYNFVLDGSHEYIANGFVVHNKAQVDEKGN